jgi:hypothetical protein
MTFNAFIARFVDLLPKSPRENSTLTPAKRWLRRGVELVGAA